ncbi:MAG: amylo-alpha-1,6-glucosidase [Syntrophomonadaceae bacterium]|nr:amylo-alpha-1,6-glucosidase [Syntrophomonadaceae bacterium]
MHQALDLTHMVDSARKPMTTEVLKDDELFITSEANGEISAGNQAGLGLYYQDTRFLSCLRIWLEGQSAAFLSSSVRESHFAQFELTNPELQKESGLIPAQSLHIRALRVLEGEFLQRLRLINFNPFILHLRLEIELAADFLDIFEIRGWSRAQRGEYYDPAPLEDGVLFGYQGLDKIQRFTQASFYPYPNEVNVTGNGARVVFNLRLPQDKKVYLYMQIKPFITDKPETEVIPAVRKNRSMLNNTFRKSGKNKMLDYQKWKEDCTVFTSSNLFLTQMLQRTITDIYALRTTYPGMGTTIQAGIPWYAAPFGRDALITGWQTFLVNPSLAKEVLYFLAAFQGQEVNAWRDEEPGKILHELRRGELSSCQEIPHTPYYGSVDATPWFIILLSEICRWTGDRALLEELKDNLSAALEWCQKYGDLDGDGFIEYLCHSDQGLVSQGWKDSWDGVIDLEGNIPAGPIALVEVQAYYYLALVRAAELFKDLGDNKRAEKLELQAKDLQQKFLEFFWREEDQFLVFALDGNKRSVITPVSNAGHCLFTGILPEEQAQIVARRLFKSDMYSGWGIRTMSKAVKPYNPMSYHNGSVWPHDNAIIAAGLRRTQHFELLQRLTTNMFEAAMFFPYHRLPELFCGFTRRDEGGPVLYPTACNPQAWAVGTIPFFVQTMLGISCNHQEVHIKNPFLPRWIDDIVVSNLKVGTGKVDLEFTRKGKRTYCGVLDTVGKVKVIIESP